MMFLYQSYLCVCEERVNGSYQRFKAYKRLQQEGIVSDRGHSGAASAKIIVHAPPLKVMHLFRFVRFTVRLAVS